MLFFEGFLLGFAMILFIGPVFFLLISLSLQLGTFAGIFVALGIFVSDFVCVCLCYYGVTSFFYQPDNKFWITLSGGVLLILLGLKYILKPFTPKEKQKEIHSIHYFNCFIKGFLINFVNPFVFFVWIGVITYLKDLAVTGYNSFLYLFGALLAILNTDLLKVFAARQIKGFLKPVVLKRIYRLSGIVLISFGIRMIYLLI